MSIQLSVPDNLLQQRTDVIQSWIENRVASRLASADPTLWGDDAVAEARIRLGWVDPIARARELIPPILELRHQLDVQGVDRVVLAGMGGSSLAPEVISRTAGRELVILDTTDPDALRRAMTDVKRTVLVVSSKSGSTVETDSQRRAFRHWFEEHGVNAADRIIVVTDPGSPLDLESENLGYRRFHADPNVGGRYSALTAFGLVPTGLAGVNLESLVDEALVVLPLLQRDASNNPALLLGALAFGDSASYPYLLLSTIGSPIVGLGDWIEQLVAESTGKNGRGVLPVVASADSAEVRFGLHDCISIRFDDLTEPRGVTDGVQPRITIDAPLGAQFLLWEYAVAFGSIAIGVNPFDQPDVESAKAAARELLSAGSLKTGNTTATETVADLATQIVEFIENTHPNGYVSICVFADSVAFAGLTELRDMFAEQVKRPVTFGWGPRFLHSTGQFHKGGPNVGSFLQIVRRDAEDLPIPDRSFTFGQLIQSQADGDAQVLRNNGSRVLQVALSAEQVHDLVRTLRGESGL